MAMDKKKIKEIFEKEGFGISAQALNIFSKLESAESKAIELVEQIKQRKFIIGGGDVLKFITKGNVPNSPSNAGDV